MKSNPELLWKSHQLPSTLPPPLPRADCTIADPRLKEKWGGESVVYATLTECYGIFLKACNS